MNTLEMINLLRGRNFTVTRYAAGSYDETTGLYVAGTTSTIQVKASLQPLSPEELDRHAGGDRTKTYFKFYTSVDMQNIEGDGLKKADKIEINGIKFRLISIERWPTYYMSILASENDQEFVDGSGTPEDPPEGGQIVYGDTDPDNGVGNDGDFYINILTSEMWGPKENGAWPDEPLAFGSGGGAVDSVNGMVGDVILDKSDIGLGNVDNTSDANKPVSTAQAVALALKANVTSPLFLGVVKLSQGSLGSSGFVFNETDLNTGMSSNADGVINVYSQGQDVLNINAGYLTHMNGIGFKPPTVQGNLGDVLTNDGFGQLSWQAPAAGGVSSVNGETGDVVIDGLEGSFNSIAGYDGSGDLYSIPDWGVTNLGGLYVIGSCNPEDGNQINSTSRSVQHTSDYDDSSVTVHNNFIELDPEALGFDFNPSSLALTLHGNFFKYVSSGDVGAFELIKNSIELGNGTDPINVGGITYSHGFGQIRNGVTLTGPVQGYGFQPAFETGAVVDSYLNAFFDYLNSPDVVFGNYQSFTSSPTIGGISNNNNFVSWGANPNIGEFFGNAGFFGLTVSPTIGSFDTGSFFGINVNPTINDVVNAYGLYINMGSTVASGTKRAIEVVGDVQIDGDLGFTGGLSIGQLNAFYQVNPVNGGGNPQTIQSLVSAVTALNGTTTANADTIGVNTAMLMTLEENSTVTSGPFGLGFTPLALPCVVQTHSGSNIDYMNAAVYAINLDPGSTGGTIQNIRLCRTVAIPNGITTVDNMVGYFFDLPFGDPATNTWGVYIEPTSAENFMAKSLKIGGTDKVTNSSVGLELEGKAFLLAELTTIERDALTAVNGMQIYNTTDNKFQGYANGSWVDFH